MKLLYAGCCWVGSCDPACDCAAEAWPKPMPCMPAPKPLGMPVGGAGCRAVRPCSVLSRRSSTWPLASICCSEATEDSCDMVLPESRLGALPYIAAWLTYEGPAPSCSCCSRAAPCMLMPGCWAVDKAASLHTDKISSHRPEQQHALNASCTEDSLRLRV